MGPRLLVVAALIVCSACSRTRSAPDSGANAGSAATATPTSGSVAGGTYSAANGDSLSFEFKSGGKVEMNGGPLGKATGTYMVEGEKLIVTLPGALPSTFIKDGNCIEDQVRMFGKLCIGGKAGAESNVSTRSAPTTAGTWVATSSDGEFRLDFKPDNKLTLTLKPPGGQPAAKDGTFIVDGDVVHVTLDQSEPMVLKFVNAGYETTSFGLPMRFVRQ
ncbi:MAG TPA: hypothetical protein VGQ17_10760 [Gemmatimonadales bacterium]|jgi:hypothetical protein|nr:hypothetical protein [Gemmatimonadales bacterium]